MDWMFAPAAGVLFSATALSLVAAALIWKRRSAPGGVLLFLLMLAVAEDTLATGLEAASVPLPLEDRVGEVPVPRLGLVSTLLLLSAVKCPGLDCWLRGWRRLATGLVLAANLAAVSTDRFHDWVWIGFLPGRPGTNTLVYLHGPGFYAAVGALFVYLGIDCSSRRRRLGEMLPRTLERTLHEGSALSAVVLDIDRFKQVNDRYGHEEGDRVLRILGRLLRQRTRPADLACRYGGEEFVVILPLAPIDVARTRAEAFLSAFLDLSTQRGHLVTLSVGVATFPTYGTTPDDLLRAADEALYAAKLAGRNCVRVPT
jgi:diguanylate cyclase (GGDEF)-like protein